jgi:hypothetical protein
VGVAIAFITSWTLLGYSRALVWELPIFGLDFLSGAASRPFHCRSLPEF